MARIRTIKPEFWDSPSTAKAGPWSRLCFIGMWNWADDFGRGTANLKELEGFIFPNDDRFTDRSGNTVNFRDIVAEVCECFGVTLYEVEGRPYYAIPSWDKHQRNERRAAQSRLPTPPDDAPLTTGNAPVAESDGISATPERKCADAPNISGPGTGEQGNRGTVKTRSPADADDPEFDAWWQHYPRKVGKGQARTAYKRATKKTDPATLLAAVQAFAEQTEGSDPKYVPHASTWLNGERWTDQPDQPHTDYSNLTEAEREWYVNNDHAPTPNPGGLTEAELEWEMANR